MDIIKEVSQLKENIDTLERYLNGKTDPEYTYALDLIKRGVCFVAVEQEGGHHLFKAGDRAFILESNRIVREVEVVKCSGGMYIIRFAEGGGIQVKGHRLFATQEEAKAGMSGKENTEARI